MYPPICLNIKYTVLTHTKNKARSLCDFGVEGSLFTSKLKTVNSYGNH